MSRRRRWRTGVLDSGQVCRSTFISSVDNTRTGELKALVDASGALSLCLFERMGALLVVEIEFVLSSRRETVY